MRDFGVVRGCYAVHVYFFTQHVVDVYGGEVGACLWEVVDSYLLGEHGSGPDVGDLEGHGGAVFIFFFDEVADFVVDGDGEAGGDVEAAD